MKKIFIVDASNYIFRSYYAIRNMSNSKGVSTNALYGFIRAIFKLQKDFSPDYLAIVFDGPRNKASRTAIYPDYKGHRAKAPDDLYPQIGFAKEFCKAFNLPIVEIDGVEADDSIGAVARVAKSHDIESFLCSSDKDLCQLIDEKTFMVHTHKDNLIFNQQEVENKYGITPNQFIDYLAIVGDSSDNIPGIKGLGPKTATKLLNEFETLEALLAGASELKNKKLAEKIETHKEEARISYKLATIDTTLDVPKEISFYAPLEPDLKALKEFYEEMEFKTLLKDLETINIKTPTNAVEKTNYLLVNDLQTLKGLVKSLRVEKEICIDTETTGINPMTAELVGIGLGSREKVSYYIPLNGAIEKRDVIKELFPLFEGNNAFYGHNIKYDMHILKRVGLDITSVCFDTLLASYILESYTVRHGLDFLCEKHFQYTKKAFKELLPKVKGATFLDVPLQEASDYCCEDVDYTIRLKNIFEKQIDEENFTDLFHKIELPILPILFAMEERGIYLDTTYLKNYSKDLTAKIATLSKSIYEEAGKEFNIKSPKQLSVILFEDLQIPPVKKTKDGYSTAADVLVSLKNAHPIIPLVLEFRTLEKLRSTYVDALPKEVNEQTHRIHCTFNQSGTVTGRLSSSSPNLQNIPVRSEEGKKVRRAFMPEKTGWSYLSLDYSQIELRILAHMSGEQALIDAFNSDKDIHTETAAHVFDVPVDRVTKDMRYRAKAVNFGIIYGQSSFGLSNELGVTRKEAKAIIETYFNKYPHVKKFIDESIETAKALEKTITLLGRCRLLPDINSKNFAVRGANERFAVNAPIQGTQSDIIKIAMITAEKALKDHGLDSYMILQIHDELIFECPENELEICEKLIKEAMESAFTLKVPLKVDVSVGKNWSEC